MRCHECLHHFPLIPFHPTFEIWSRECFAPLAMRERHRLALRRCEWHAVKAWRWGEACKDWRARHRGIARGLSPTYQDHQYPRRHSFVTADCAERSGFATREMSLGTSFYLSSSQLSYTSSHGRVAIVADGRTVPTARSQPLTKSCKYSRHRGVAHRRRGAGDHSRAYGESKTTQPPGCWCRRWPCPG